MKEDLRISAKLLLCSLVIIILMLFPGCALLSVDEIPSTVFLAHSAQLKRTPERISWQGLWFNDQQRLLELVKRYGKIALLPVETTYAAGNLYRQIKDDQIRRVRLDELNQVAKFMRENFKIAIEDYHGGHLLRIIDEPEKDALVLRLAIVEIKPTNFAANAVGTVAGLLLPGAGLLKLIGRGSIAFEGVLCDGGSGEVLMEFKDRQTDKHAPFSVKDFQEYAHIRTRINNWAGQFAELLATSPDHKVEDSLPFDLLPL